MVKVNLLAPGIQARLSTSVYLPVWGFVGGDVARGEAGTLRLVSVDVRTGLEGVTRDRARKVGRWIEERS